MSLSHHTLPLSTPGLPRHDWTREEVGSLFALPFPELIFRAAQVHRQNFDPGEVQISTLLSIKTGGCPEDCAYCPQSAKFDTGVKAEKLMDLDAVVAEARAAKAGGASRFCMGAAWRSPKDRDLDKVCEMVEGVKALGMETCVTLGMLTGDQARRLKTVAFAWSARRESLQPLHLVEDETPPGGLPRHREGETAGRPARWPFTTCSTRP